MNAVAVRAGALLLGGLGTAAAALAQAPTQADCDATSFQRVLHATPSQPALQARALWLDRRLIRWPQADNTGGFRLYHSATAAIVARSGVAVTGADGALELDLHTATLELAEPRRFSHIGSGPVLAVRAGDLERLDALHQGQLVLVHEDAGGRVRDASHVQVAGAFDDRFAAAVTAPALGVTLERKQTRFRLWAPSARAVALCLYSRDDAPSEALLPMQRDQASGIWEGIARGDLAGRYYTYLVDVPVANLGIVRNRITDPYATGLGLDSRRGYVADFDAPALMPPGWRDKPAPPTLAAPTDQVIYELHVRDFSANDASVRPDYRGRYLAFTEPDSAGVRHLRALAAAGITDVHLLPVFDFATVPERDCVTPAPSGPPDGEAQQATVAAVKDRDCFNWGYDPWHFNAPEGSYATDAADGAVRIRELRAMVQALHGMGLRVGMDVVYNHTTASGQGLRSVLDRAVPGYYQRLDARGRVETSTCCDNTATEHAMMARLMIDSAVHWVRQYRIDSFRFDLMGHQPRAAMQALQAAVNAAAGRHVELLGEGWNFGEVADGARFEQASQLALQGTGIATFSDRARDAVRGGGCCDSGTDLVLRQGFVNGLHYAPNAQAQGRTSATDLLRTADMVRVGLAGTLREYVIEDHRGQALRLDRLDYVGQPAGYAAEPFEVVNYVENHDNQTLYDVNVFKLPRATSLEDRARVQILAAAVVAFSQGIAYYHAGIELLRSKSLDRNSYDSGDWFNRIDWRGQDSTFGSGLPPSWDNASSWPTMRPLLADPALKPTAQAIGWTRAAFLDLLRLRASSSLFRLRRAADVQARLRLLNTGPDQVPTVLVGHLDGDGYPGAAFRELLYFINVETAARTLSLPSERGKDYVLHPVHRADTAGDARPRLEARYDAATGAVVVPARTALVFVVETHDGER